MSFALFSTGVAAEDTIMVDEDYDTIQEAIDEAGSEDIVELEAGTYEEDIAIDVEELTLQGPNTDNSGDSEREEEAIIEGQITITSDDVRVEGVNVVDQEADNVIEFQGTEGTEVVNNVVEANPEDLSRLALGHWGGDSGGDVTVQDNKVTGAIGLYPSEDAEVEIVGNTVTEATDEGIWTYGAESEQTSFNLKVEDNEVLEYGNKEIKLIFIPNKINGIDVENSEETAYQVLNSNLVESVEVSDSAYDRDIENADQEAYYTSIQDAVDTAEEGDEIKVGAGNYELEETVKIRQDDLRLTGEDGATIQSSEEADRDSETSFVIEEAENVEISGFEFIDFLTTDGANAISLRNSDGAKINDNLFAHNLEEEKDEGEWTSTGIVVTDSKAVEILGNEFDIQGASAIGASGNYFGDLFDWTEEGNHVEDLKIEGNIISADTAVTLQEEVRSTTVENNKIDSQKAIESVKLESYDPSETEIRSNKFVSETSIDAKEHEEVLDATENYWSDPTGLDSSQVEGDVEWRPYYPTEEALDNNEVAFTFADWKVSENEEEWSRFEANTDSQRSVSEIEEIAEDVAPSAPASTGLGESEVTSIVEDAVEDREETIEAQQDVIQEQEETIEAQQEELESLESRVESVENSMDDTAQVLEETGQAEVEETPTGLAVESPTESPGVFSRVASIFG